MNTGIKYNNISLVANATPFDFLFHRLVLRREHFTYSNLAWGLRGGVDVKWGLEA
jgi:hypothetical protein